MRMTRSRCRCSAVLVAVLIMACLLPSPADARLAVFVDGRVLRVTDAVLDGDRIVLELVGGGLVEVPATAIDRVITDEIVTETDDDLPVCSAAWAEEPLPPAIPHAAAIEEAARRAGVHPWLLAALVQAESAFDARAVSRAGARGLTQLMPAAANDWGVDDPFDPEQSLRGGASHLRRLLDRFDSLPVALAAYNAGAATVERAGGIPPYRETHAYVRRILAVFCPRAAAALEATPPPGV